MLNNKFLILSSNSKLENDLGWKANETFDTGIVTTIECYLEKYNN